MNFIKTISIIIGTVLIFVATALGTAAENHRPKAFNAKLSGHAILPAMTFVPAPLDAPQSFQVSGRFTGRGAVRNDNLYSVAGKTWVAPKDAPRMTGLYLPFVGQPVQGFSGIKKLDDGEFMVLVDNGFGNKRNSPDSMLMIHRIRPDWKTGQIRVVKTIFLHDPDRVIPFRLVNEHTDKRYLTGSDLDPEGMQLVGDLIWFGDEFGPYIFATDKQGRIVAFFETVIDGKIVHSPDHYSLKIPSKPGKVTFEVRRSRGFEGMAASSDGKFLYPLLEGPLWDAERKAWESVDEKRFLRILEFDTEDRAFTGRHWKYMLEHNKHRIGDFNMISNTRGLIIERDSGEGDPKEECSGAARSDCFSKAAKFKRVYLIEFPEEQTEFVRKIAYIDLMDIDDPNGVAKRGSSDGKFTFPFLTIENVDRVDERHIIVGNDNNLPFSSGRKIGKADDNELILLDVGRMLTIP
jgi:hypothetical protein